ncbi:mandelate racemase/muconate lactonizing enzyme family protein [Candidatus Latescibacterota bacterium]
MKRRSFINSILLGTGAALTRTSLASAALPKMKITRIRLYESPSMQLTSLIQSSRIVTIETDAGITGIGDGGLKDTIESCAPMLIGQNPFQIEYLWQRMYRGASRPGREKLHAVGALDVALWDIKGKALDVPVYELLGGRTREHFECYSTGFPGKGSLKETARACIEAGFRVYRTSTTSGGQDKLFDARKMVQKTYERCVEIREGVGEDGDWAIDYHTRLDLADAIRLSTLIEELNPYFVEDLIRSENPGVYRTLRDQVRVPIAVGEQFGDRWDINELIEQHLIDYSRVYIPNTGGITEYMKIAALCETHYVGLIPHFTGPVATAALVHACGAFSGPVLMEVSGSRPREYPYLPQAYDFKDGKIWLNTRPGLGVEFDPQHAQIVAEITEPVRVWGFQRSDGSYTNW